MKNFDDIRKSGDLLFESIRGSHLFGLNTENSDIDTFGVFCGPEEWFLGSGKDMQQYIKSEKSDDYWDELGKYFFELSKSNPEALVSLFTPEKFILHFDPILQPLWDIRDQLLTKECFKSFSGYAYSQIKKAKGLKKAINTDPEEVKERKNPLYFCQVPVGIGTHTLKKWLEDRGLRQECCGISRLPNSNECYALFYDWGKARELGDDVYNDDPVIGYRGILSQDDPLTSQLRLSSIPKNEKPLCWFQFNSNAYTSHCIEYKRYWDWVKNRNEARFQLNSGYNYDCYLTTETKFLTKRGWLNYYDIIDSDELACFDKKGNLMYSKIKSRTHYTPKDNEEIIINTYSDTDNNICFHVTDNHRMWVRRNDWDGYGFVRMIDIKEQLKQGYSFYQLRKVSTGINKSNLTNEQIELLALLIAQCSSEVRNPYVFTDNYSDNYIRCLLDRAKIKYKDLYIGLELDISSFIGDELKSLMESHTQLYLYNKADSVINIINTFSTSQLELFFTTLEKFCVKDYFKEYNKLFRFRLDLLKPSRSREFIKYFCLICNLRGYKVTNYSKSNIPHLSVLNNLDNEVMLNPTYLTVKKTRNSICCFETETGTLITGGRHPYDSFMIRPMIEYGISFHGNSKNISHCVRIFTMAKEIAEGKGMILDRTNVDRDILLSIKNHEIPYDDIIKRVESLRDNMEESFIKSNLPECPDKDLLDKILINIRRKHYAKRK